MWMWVFAAASGLLSLMWLLDVGTWSHQARNWLFTAVWLCGLVAVSIWALSNTG